MGASIGVNEGIERLPAAWPGTAGARSRRGAVRGLARWLSRALLVVLLFVGAGAAGLGLYAASHADRIYEGVSVAGVAVGGMERDAAAAAVEQRFAEYARTPLTLTVAGEERRFTLTPAEAGARLDGAGTIGAAFAYGRTGSVWERSQEWARGLFGEVAIAPRVEVEREVIDGWLRGIAPAVVWTPVDARVAMAEAGGPALVPDRPGVVFDLAGTRAALARRLTRLESGPVAIATQPQAAGVVAAELAPRVEAARAAVDAPLVLSTAEGVWHVPAADLARVVSVDPASAELRVAGEPLRGVVREVAAQVDRAPVDAGLTVGADGRLAAVPGVDAARVDVERTTAAVGAALLAGEDAVELSVERAAPAITDGMAAAAAARGEALIGDGMALSWAGGRAELARRDLLRALTITSRPGGEEPFVFGLDRAVVGELLAAQAAAFDQPAVDAKFRIVDGRVKAVAEAKQGRQLDVKAGTEAVLVAFGAEKPSAKLPVKPLAPTWTAADGGKIALGDAVIAEASTFYGTSSEPRRHNVDRAVELQDAWLVPPDGVFSYVENVGAVDAGNGFVTGFGIVADEDGGITTAPVIGGGICQVSTTIYQAAFWAGLAVEERYQHPYYLRSYGEAPRGLPGLDAMVNIEADWALDLKFRNTTENWIAVLVIGDGQNVTAKIVGTDPGWEVRVGAPKITNLVPKETGMSFSESPELEAGRELFVESAEDGFDVTIERQVVKNGKVILEDSVSSSFAPARNLTLRGTGAGA